MRSISITVPQPRQVEAWLTDHDLISRNGDLDASLPAQMTRRRLEYASSQYVTSHPIWHDRKHKDMTENSHAVGSVTGANLDCCAELSRARGSPDERMPWRECNALRCTDIVADSTARMSIPSIATSPIRLAVTHTKHGNESP